MGSEIIRLADLKRIFRIGRKGRVKSCLCVACVLRGGSTQFKVQPVWSRLSNICATELAHLSNVSCFIDFLQALPSCREFLLGIHSEDEERP